MVSTYKQQLLWCHGMFCRPAAPAAIESKEFKRPKRPPQRPGPVQQACHGKCANFVTSRCPKALIVMNASSRWRMILDISRVPSLARLVGRPDFCEIYDAWMRYCMRERHVFFFCLGGGGTAIPCYSNIFRIMDGKLGWQCSFPLLGRLSGLPWVKSSILHSTLRLSVLHPRWWSSPAKHAVWLASKP